MPVNHQRKEWPRNKGYISKDEQKSGNSGINAIRNVGDIESLRTKSLQDYRSPFPVRSMNLVTRFVAFALGVHECCSSSLSG